MRPEAFPSAVAAPERRTVLVAALVVALGGCVQPHGRAERERHAFRLDAQATPDPGVALAFGLDGRTTPDGAVAVGAEE